MTTIQPVILSGGAGTRLWPASHAACPKQFLPLLGEQSLLQQTVLRVRDMANVSNNVLVVCNDAHRFLVAEQMRTIGCNARIVLEPAGRNTAPATALAALLSVCAAPTDAVPLLLVMPADHVIDDTEAFLQSVAAGEQAAMDGRLVVFGVAPSSPNTGYGYIEADVKESGAAPIRSFVEKPDLKTAVTLLETNRHFWNSGIFLFRADTWLQELQAYEPQMLAACRESVENAVIDEDFVRPDAEAFLACPSDSIDYAVMEKTTRGAMIPMTAGWSDVGSWSALHDVSAQDDAGNAISGSVVALDCRSSYIRSSSRLVAALGLENLVVVESEDAVLIAHRDRSQDVKRLVEQLHQQQGGGE